MKVLLIAGAFWLSASATQAQIVIDVASAPNNGEIIACMTRMCRSAIADVTHYMPRPSVNRTDVQTCSAANQALGRWIAQVARNLTTRQDSGQLTYDQAADARNLIHSETFVLRNLLRETVTTGDVRRCEVLKDRAILVVNQILRSSVGYTGPIQSQGFAYGSSK